MLVTINVTQEDIDHGSHISCHNCMLGSAIQKVLKGAYWPKVETVAVLSRDRSDEEWDEFHRTHSNPHVSFSITEFENSTKFIFGPIRLPEVACKMADQWEFEHDPKEFVNHPDLKVEPFSFQVEIPKEYLKGET